MIAFKLKDGFLQLDNQTSVSLVWNSPLFDAESLTRAFAWDFIVPFTPLNNRLLNFAYRFDASMASDTHFCTVYINGLQALTGQITVNEITDGYRVFFQNDTLSLKTVLDNELPYFITDSIDLIYNSILPNALFTGLHLYIHLKTFMMFLLP